MLKRTLALFLVGLFAIQTALAVSQVTLAWDLSTSAGVISQKFYYSNTPVNPSTGRFNAPVTINLTATDTTKTVGNLADGTYYFAVTAVANGGIESVYSNVAQRVIVTPSPTPSPTPPSAPTNLHFVP